MSPAGATSLEEQQYMEKLKQLSKYIEPLRRMINKIDKNEGERLTFDLSLQMISSPQRKTITKAAEKSSNNISDMKCFLLNCNIIL